MANSTITQIPSTTGGRIRWARKRAGLSLDKLGLAVGTSRQHLIRLEQDVHTPRAVMLEKIAEATGQKLEFFGEAAENQREVRDRLREQDDAARDLATALMRMVDLTKGLGQ
jgi:transcriptional regulator with XRE-family HTH domain